jgi:hypothetical protein
MNPPLTLELIPSTAALKALGYAPGKTLPRIRAILDRHHVGYVQLPNRTRGGLMVVKAGLDKALERGDVRKPKTPKPKKPARPAPAATLAKKPGQLGLFRNPERKEEKGDAEQSN